MVVQPLTVVNPTVHDRVQEDDEAKDDDKGDGKPGIKETNDEDLNKKHIIDYLAFSTQSTCTKISREYWPTASMKKGI